VKLRFGPAGRPLGLKSADILDAPRFLYRLGLTALEYVAVRGVNIDPEKAWRLGEEAQKYDIVMSLHAPYYVNLASPKRLVVESSITRLIEAVKISAIMRAQIVVFHPGYYMSMSRREALERVIRNLSPVVEFAKEVRVWLSPETTGRIAQIGDLDEVIEICRRLDRLKPTIDWAHLYARYSGKLIVSKDDVIKVVERLEKELGEYAVKPLHSHFSRIEFSKHGEVRHRSLEEKSYGPEFRYVCEALCEVGIDAIIISESPLLELDALKMKEICVNICGSKCVSD